jgi:hypothetical protein
MSEKTKKVYVVALVERYETLVLASSRQSAIDAVDHHGGSDPVWTKVTAQPAKDQNLDSPDIEGD